MNDLSKKPDYFYKFRKYSSLSLKEIFYGEMYFSSLYELNDPYDTKIYYCFKKNIGKYNRLLHCVIKDSGLKLPDIDLSSLAAYLSETDLSYEELIEKIKSEMFENLLFSELSKKRITESIALSKKIISHLKHEIHKRVGRNLYIVSFTKSFDNPLMWSHYSDEHRGFCVIINPDKNYLLQNPNRRKIKSTDGNGNKTFCKDNKKYIFEQAQYEETILPLDGFINFNPYINEKKEVKGEVDKFWKNFKKTAVTKYLKWKYEDEYRLIDDSDCMTNNNNVDESGVKIKPIIERIFHYDQTQLTGIIFGFKMSKIVEDEIKSTIKKMRENLSWECYGCLPLFVFYKAEQNLSKYSMNINPELGLDHENNEFKPDEIVKKRNEYYESLDTVKNKMGIKDEEFYHSIFL